MPFIPHTEADVAAMLAAIGESSTEALFEEIPAELRVPGIEGIPPAANEMAIMRLMHERAQRDGHWLSFLGAGAYEHHIPAAVWQIATRGEFYSSYTPYQAEASQGALQVLYEYQSMVTALTGLPVTNASLYDGASALAEAVLMAVRLQKGRRRILMPRSVHPVWRRVVATIVRNQGIELIEVGFDVRSGTIARDQLTEQLADGAAAIVLPQPGFFGTLDDVDGITDWAHTQGLLVIGLVNPTALAMLKPPGAWGREGADIATGDGQPLGIPLSSGGPYFGFLACREAYVRQLPGRIVARTVDADGRTGYTLTLQAREQHIRRSKATSNICTNQGLMVTAATIYMALLGGTGLADVARTSHANAMRLCAALTGIKGIARCFPTPVFHEFVIRLDRPAGTVLRALEAHGILGGRELAPDYPELGEAILVCATETKTADDLQRYAGSMAEIMATTL